MQKLAGFSRGNRRKTGKFQWKSCFKPIFPMEIKPG